MVQISLRNAPGDVNSGTVYLTAEIMNQPSNPSTEAVLKCVTHLNFVDLIVCLTTRLLSIALKRQRIPHLGIQ